jgi:hypothetical protein
MAVNPDDPTFLDRIRRATQPFGGMGNLGLALLANSAPTREPQSLGSILGRSALQAQGGVAQQQEADLMRRYREAQIQQMQAREAPKSPFGNVDPAKYTRESVAKFEQSGKYSDLEVDPKAMAGQTPADVATYQYWAGLGQNQQQDFLKLKRNIGSDYQVVDVNGVPTVIYKPGAGQGMGAPLAGPAPGRPMAPQQGVSPGAAPPPGQAAPSTAYNPPFMTPLTTLPNQLNAAAQLKAAESQAGAIGTATGTAQGAQITKGIAANTIVSMLDLADPFIDVAIGSLAGTGADKLAAAFGKAPTGAQAIAQLKVLQAGIMLNQPRMEGPQSDRDVELYRDAAGQLGDPTVPREIKKVAVKTIRQLQDKYKENAAQVPKIYENGSPQAQKADIEAEMKRRGLLK